MINFFFCRYDPNVELPTDVDTEQDRVLFIKSLAQFMVLLNVLYLARELVISWLFWRRCLKHGASI